MTRRPLEPAEACRSYVNGDCYYFALALHRLTGLPMLEVGNEQGGYFCGGHAVVELPNGLVADAAGAWERDEMLAEWSAAELRPLSEQDLMSSFADEEDGEPLGLSAEAIEIVASARAEMLADHDFLDALGVSWREMSGDGGTARPAPRT